MIEVKCGVEAGLLLELRAQLARQQGKTAASIRHYEDAIGALERVDARADLARVASELGDFLLEQKRPAEAAPYFARALRELRPASAKH